LNFELNEKAVKGLEILMDTTIEILSVAMFRAEDALVANKIIQELQKLKNQFIKND
jgi:hypothetical protein